VPAHGTVPAALTDVEWEDWMAATRLAVREARRLTGPSAPLHLVGFSNGGALALMLRLIQSTTNDCLERIALC
jgi:alpha-beta hydrolase superfamily lysophospholipase